MNFTRALILAVMDLLLLSEMTFGIWYAHLDMSEVSWRFVQVFCPAALVTVLATRWAMKRWAPKTVVDDPEAARGPYRPVNLFGALANVGENRPRKFW